MVKEMDSKIMKLSMSFCADTEEEIAEGDVKEDNEKGHCSCVTLKRKMMMKR